jgi:hypothetical protein
MTTRKRRIFKAETAVRDRMPIMVGFTGPSGSGKTLSAIRFGTGICAAVGEGPLVVIDADSGRAKQYAPLPGHAPSPPETYAFERISLDAPYGSLDFADAIWYASHVMKASAIVVDPFCREHYGPGGYMSLQKQEAERLKAEGKGDGGSSWTTAAEQRKAMFEDISAIGTRSALLFCFRAVPKLNWNTPRGKGPEPKGIVPATTNLFVWNMICNVFFPYNALGVPCWNPEMPGEKALVKGAPVWAREIFQGLVTEDTGRRVALWALGDVHENVRRRELAQKHDEEHKQLLAGIRSNLQERGYSMKTDADALTAEIQRCFGCDTDRLPHLENDELAAGLETLRNPPSETVEPEIPDSEIDSLVSAFAKAKSPEAYLSLDAIYLSMADAVTEEQRHRTVVAGNAARERLGIDQEDTSAST